MKLYIIYRDSQLWACLYVASEMSTQEVVETFRALFPGHLWRCEID